MPVTSLTSYFNIASFGDRNSYTRNQEELALTLDSAAHELSNWKNLLAMSAGGGAFEGGKLFARTFLSSGPVLSAVPLLTNAFTFISGALADTGLTCFLNHALGNEADESFLDQMTSQSSVRLMGLVGMGQSFVVVQLLQGLASVSRGMLCENNSQNKKSGFLHHLILGAQCYFGSGMFGYLMGGVVSSVEQRISLQAKNMYVRRGSVLSLPENFEKLAWGVVGERTSLAVPKISRLNPIERLHSVKSVKVGTNLEQVAAGITATELEGVPVLLDEALAGNAKARKFIKAALREPRDRKVAMEFLAQLATHEHTEAGLRFLRELANVKINLEKYLALPGDPRDAARQTAYVLFRLAEANFNLSSFQLRLRQFEAIAKSYAKIAVPHLSEVLRLDATRLSGVSLDSILETLYHDLGISSYGLSVQRVGDNTYQKISLDSVDERGKLFFSHEVQRLAFELMGRTYRDAWYEEILYPREKTPRKKLAGFAEHAGVAVQLGDENVFVYPADITTGRQNAIGGNEVYADAYRQVLEYVFLRGVPQNTLIRIIDLHTHPAEGVLLEGGAAIYKDGRPYTYLSQGRGDIGAANLAFEFFESAFRNRGFEGSVEFVKAAVPTFLSSSFFLTDCVLEPKKNKPYLAAYIIRKTF